MWLFVPFVFGLLVRGALPWQYLVIPVVLTHVLTLFVQQVVGRERPPIAESRIRMWRRTPSFPSAHSAGSMAFAFAIAFASLPHGNTGVVVSVFVFLLAVLIGVSRIVVGVHYLTDVVCGLIFGLLITGLFTVSF